MVGSLSSQAVESMLNSLREPYSSLQSGLVPYCRPHLRGRSARSLDTLSSSKRIFPKFQRFQTSLPIVTPSRLAARMSQGTAIQSEPDCETTGILTQTVLSSPVIQWILPARLRSKKLNDVVFVGHRRLHIKEAANGGYLEDVMEKSDFDGTIISAKVLDIGSPIPWEQKLNHGEPASASNGYMDHHDNLPSQILVLSLDYKELLFLCCPRGPISSKPEFVTYRRPLPVDVSLAERYGKHVAVDPM